MFVAYRSVRVKAPAQVRPRIYIDLTDVVTHATWHSSCCGIPRVQLELATALMRSNEDVVPFSLYDKTWRDLRPLIAAAAGDTDLLLRRFGESLPYRGMRPSWRKPRQTLQLIKARLRGLRDRLFSRMPRLRPEDTVFVGGVFWTSKVVRDYCRQAIAKSANLVVLIHDLIPFSHPEFTGADFAAEYREVLRLPAHFVVTTDFNRNALEDVRREMGVNDPTSVSVLPLAHEFPGATRNDRPRQPPPRLADLAKRDFVLCVGTVEIRKNHLMLLALWDKLAAERGDDMPVLVIAGRRGWKADAALRRLDDSGDPRIRFVEAPSDEELRWLYSACSFTVFPSLFEGWGLPVGESLWFGKACAASNASSMPFVGGELCLHFSPHEATAFADAIRSLLDPDFRRSYEAKIAAAPLRDWAEVGAQLESVIARQCSRSKSRNGLRPLIEAPRLAMPSAIEARLAKRSSLRSRAAANITSDTAT